MNFAVQADHRVKLKESEKCDKYLELAREQKTATNKQTKEKTNKKLQKKKKEYEGDGDTICIWCTWDYPQKIGKRTGKLGSKRFSRCVLQFQVTELNKLLV